MVIEGLTSMGIPNACSFVIHWLNKHFHAIANFVEGCEYVKLECKWDSKQIKAFMEYLYKKHYAVSTLDTQWSTLCLVGKTLGEWIPLELEVSFQFVKDEGKETKDDKFLILRRLLFELCEASDIILTGHNVLLAKTMFLCVWAFSVRISEFSKTQTSPIGSQRFLHMAPPFFLPRLVIPGDIGGRGCHFGPSFLPLVTQEQHIQSLRMVRPDQQRPGCNLQRNVCSLGEIPLPELGSSASTRHYPPS